MTASDIENPLELFEIATERMGCQLGTIPDQADMRVAVMEGNHGTVPVMFKWFQIDGRIGFSFSYIAPERIPAPAVPYLHTLVNLMNAELRLGRWTYLAAEGEQGTRNRICWRYEVPSTLIGDDGDELIASILETVRHIYDDFYPVVALFFSGKEKLLRYDGFLVFSGLTISPEEAISHLYQARLVGRA